VQDDPSIGEKEHPVMIKQLTATTLGLAAIFAANPVRADYLVFTNRASFEAAITGEQTETFNELGPTLQSFGSTGLAPSATGLAQPISLTGSGGFLLSASASSLAGFYASNGTYLLGPVSNSATDGLTVTLPPNTYTAAGADVGVFASNSVVNFVVTTSNGTTFNSSVGVDTSSPGSSLGFLGVVDTTPGDFVTSLTFSAPVGLNQNVVVDNFSFGFAPQAVPEPASMALLVTGSLAIGATALRRRLREKVA
jgi:PEP-CTERM motif